MRVVDWYASDVRAGNQSSVVGAVGFAGKYNPLAMALLRLFVGDDRAAHDIVPMLAQKLAGKAYRQGEKLPKTTAEDMARAVLAWHRDGVCKPCSGLGYTRIEGSPSLSEHACPSCRGTKKRAFEPEFKPTHVGLARWLLAELEREHAVAGIEARKRLAPTLAQ